ncbi:MAG TPA: response regulator [Gemmatimonadales bacterium]
MSEALHPHQVLVVDDTEANRYTVSRILRQHGFGVREAATGRDGLDALAAGADLVVLDIRLPDMDGFEICRRIKADPATRDVPVLHISASLTGTDARVRGLEGGADGYLVHPVEPAELVATVRALLRARDAEARVRAAAREWTLTFDSIADPVCLTRTDQTVMRCNRAFAALAEAEFAAILGRPVRELLPGLGDALPEPGAAPVEVQLGGRWFRLSVSSSSSGNRSPQGLAWVFADVTAHKRAEAELLASRAQLQFITDAAPVYIAHCDADGRYRFVNRTYAERFGRPLDDIIGRSIREVVGEEGYRQLLPHMQRVLRGEPVEFEVEVNYPVLGQRRMHCTYVPEPGAGGSTAGFLAVIADVTEWRRNEEALRHTQKLESIGVLAGGVAHDFNNLLTGILGNASLALRTLPGSHPAAQLIADVVRGSERAAALTAQLLAYAGKGRFHLERIDLAHLVHDITALIRTLIPRNVEVVLDLAEPLPEVIADAGQLQQVVMNLVINAGEAIGERPGSVRVDVHAGQVGAEELRARFAIFDLAPGRYVRLEVTDDGCGMTEETLAQVFEPFFTTKFLGRGLGLAATLGIVRSHHGGIAVSSAPGQGSRITVLLPEAPLAAPNDAERPAESSEDMAPRGTILVVDDEELVRAVARAALTRRGYAVLEAATGREALELMQRHHGDIALVLLDMTMPVMSGGEAAQRIRREWRDLPIVATSGYGEDEAMRRFTGTDVSAFLQKPYKEQQLLALVRAVLGRATPPQGLPSRDHPS